MLLPILFLLSSVCGGPPATPTPTAREELSRYAGSHHVQRTGSGKSIEITDEIVSAIAGEGKSPAATSTPARAMEAEEGKKEYWVRRYREAIELQEELEGRLAEVRREIPVLWRAFYTEDNPELRDEVLAAELQKKLDLRAKLEEELKRAKTAFADLKVAARKAGALPGWFRGLKSDGP